MRGHSFVLLALVAVHAAGCAAVFGLEQTTPGLSRWADGAMRQRFLATSSCPSDRLEYRYLGQVPRTVWHRHEISGCDVRRIYWTACSENVCQLVTDALEERAALDFDCDVDAITVEGMGSSMRARGCDQTGVYVITSAGWVLNSEEMRPPERASTEPRASAQ